MPATGPRYLPMATTSSESVAYFQLSQDDTVSEVFDRNQMGAIPPNNVSGMTKIATATVEDHFEWNPFYFKTWERDKLENVSSWNNIHLVSSDAFRGCTNLKGFSARSGPTISTPSMNFAFEGCSSFDSELRGWDFSNVTQAFGCFNGCTSLSDANFRKIVKQWHRTRNNTMRADDDIIVGSEGVEVTTLETYDAIQAAGDDGVVFTGYTVNIDGVEILTYKNDVEYKTPDWRYRGTPTVIVNRAMMEAQRNLQIKQEQELQKKRAAEESAAEKKRALEERNRELAKQKRAKAKAAERKEKMIKRRITRQSKDLV